MPPQVKGQSAELTSGFGELQAAQAAVERQQAALAEQKAALEADRKAAKAEQAEAQAQAAAEARLAAATEQRKAGQARLASLRAAEEAREMQLRLAAQVRAAVAAGVPGAEGLWRQLATAVGVAPDALAAEAAATPAFPALPAVAVAGMASSPAASPTKPRSLAPVLAPAAAPQPPAAAAADTGSRYRAILADLEGSIERWRGQLRAGEPLSFGGSHLGGPSYFMPLPMAQPAVPGSPAAMRHRSSPGKEEQQRLAEQPAEDAAGEPGAGEVETSSPSSSRAVQTAVSFTDVPRAVRDDCACVGASSLPCSPAKGRRGLAQATLAARPASAGAAVAGEVCGGSGGGSSGGSPRIAAVGQVRAVSTSGLTLEAEYSVAGSPRHSKPRKWLKWKGSDGEAAGEAQGTTKNGAAQHSTHSSGDADGGSSKGSWSRGIFAFRRSVDGGKQ